MEASFSYDEVFARILSKNRWATERELAQALGVSPNTWTAYKKGKSSFGLNDIAKICDVLGVDSDWLLFGERLERRPNAAINPSGYEQSFGEVSPIGDFIALPFLDIHASAGHGAIVPVHEEARTVISFERTFLRSLGATPDWCKIIGARGDSMTPTIPDGALIVVDHSQTEVVNGWISVVNVGGDLLVKRVRRRLDGTVELVSDNPIYPVETIGSDRIDQLTIIGRVVYFCRAP